MVGEYFPDDGTKDDSTEDEGVSAVGDSTEDGVDSTEDEPLTKLVGNYYTSHISL